MNRPQVLLVDPIHKVGIDALDGTADWRVSRAKDQAELARELADVEGVIIRVRLKLDAATFDAAPNLRIAGRHGVGFDNIDVDAATERGIWIVNTPEANAETVAEHAIGMMLLLTRSMHRLDRATRDGNWQIRDEVLGGEVFGTTLGIVGMGRIGARVAEIAVGAFSQRVLYADVVSRPDLEESLGIEHMPLEQLLSESDIVTVHVPSLPATIGMIDAPQFAQMKPGAILVNASRGRVVVESALLDALDSGQVSAAGIDVFAEEPPPTDLPLIRHPNVFVTPHTAGVSVGSMQRMALVSEDIARVLRGERPKYPVNDPT